MSFSHGPIIAPDGSGGGGDGAVPSRPLYAQVLAEIPGDKDRSRLEDNGTVAIFENRAGEQFTTYLDLRGLTSETSIGSGMVVVSGGIDDFDATEGIEVTEALIRFPSMGLRNWTEGRHWAVVVRLRVRATGTQSLRGIAAGIYSPNLNYFIGAGIAPRNSSRWGLAALIEGTPGSLVFNVANGGQLPNGFLPSGQLVQVHGSFSAELPSSNDVDMLFSAKMQGVDSYNRDIRDRTIPAAWKDQTDIQPAILCTQGTPAGLFTATVESIEVIKQ